jgi:hypothetical protein
MAGAIGKYLRQILGHILKIIEADNTEEIDRPSQRHSQQEVKKKCV